VQRKSGERSEWLKAQNFIHWAIVYSSVHE